MDWKELKLLPRDLLVQWSWSHTVCSNIYPPTEKSFPFLILIPFETKEVLPDPHRNHGCDLVRDTKDPLPWRDQVVRMTSLLLILPARARESVPLHTGLLMVSTESQNTCYHILKSSWRQRCWQPLETCSVSTHGGYKGTSLGWNPPASGKASLRDLRVVSMIQRTVIRPFPHPLFSLLATQKENQTAFL